MTPSLNLGGAYELVVEQGGVEVDHPACATQHLKAETRASASFPALGLAQSLAGRPARFSSHTQLLRASF